MMPLTSQFASLLMLALPMACASWTVTHEEVFREPREFCKEQSERVADVLPVRKFFYLFTCEYCFSHYVTAFFLLITRFTMLYEGWRGYLIVVVCAGVDCECVHEHLQPAAARDQARERGDCDGAGGAEEGGRQRGLSGLGVRRCGSFDSAAPRSG